MEDLPESLQDKLEEYNRNFEALSVVMNETNTLEANASTELQVEQTRAMITQALPIAVKTMIGITAYGTSETNRRLASQYIIDRVLGRDGDIKSEDEATKLLKRLLVSEGKEV